MTPLTPNASFSVYERGGYETMGEEIWLCDVVVRDDDTVVVHDDNGHFSIDLLHDENNPYPFWFTRYTSMEQLYADLCIYYNTYSFCSFFC